MALHNITRIKQAKEDIRDAIIAKGVEVATTDKIDTYADKIAQIEQGGGGTGYTGHVDEVGLREIGWQDDDIEYFKSIVWWNEECDDAMKVNETSKQCYRDKGSGAFSQSYFTSSGEYYLANYCPRFAQKTNVGEIMRGNALKYWPLMRNIHNNGSFANMLVNQESANPINCNIDGMTLGYQAFGNFCASQTALIYFSMQDVNLTYTSANVGLNYCCMNDYCLKNANIDVNAPKLSNVGYAFYNCYALENASIIVRNSNVTSFAISNAFYNCYSLRYVKLDVPKLNTAAKNVFYNCRNLLRVDGVLDMSNVTDVTSFTSGCSSLSYILLKGLKVSISINHRALEAYCLHYAIANAIGGTADAYITFTVNALAKARWQASEYYAEDVATAAAKYITIA